MPKLVISQELIDDMVSHCRAVYPNEACGILAGKKSVAEKLYRMTNIEESPVSYMMDPKEQFFAMKEMRNDGYEMVAIYHSHPDSPSYPSPRDVSLAFYSDTVYVIVSLADNDRPDIRAFEIAEGDVAETGIEITG